MTRSKFKQYIKSMLGSPVINVEIEDGQMENHIDDTLQLFMESHYDGTDLSYIGLSVTTSEIQTYELPATVQEVLNILNPDTTNYQIFDEPLMVVNNYGSSGILGGVFQFSPSQVEVARQSYKSAENSFAKEVLFEYNGTTKKLTFLTKPDANFYFIECYVSESNYEKYYDNIWVKKYATALCKRQWGTNVGKYTGTALPGGVSVDYNRIISEAQVEIDKLEQELHDKYQTANSSYIG